MRTVTILVVSFLLSGGFFFAQAVSVGILRCEYILGIRPDESRPGYRRFTVKPLPGGGLEWAKESYHAITGHIEVFWTDRNRTFSLDVTVPPNTEATVVTPFDGKTHSVGSANIISA